MVVPAVHATYWDVQVAPHLPLLQVSPAQHCESRLHGCVVVRHATHVVFPLDGSLHTSVPQQSLSLLQSAPRSEHTAQFPKRLLEQVVPAQHA